MKSPRFVPHVFAQQVRVLPNRHTLGLGAVLVGMLYAGLTQNNGAAYLLCFALTGVALVSIAHAWANLRGVTLEAGIVPAVFAGEELAVPLHASSTNGHEHFGVQARSPEAEDATEIGRIPPTGSVATGWRCPAEERGRFPGLDVRIESQFPLGFFTARRIIRLAAPHHVYPVPDGNRPLPVSFAGGRPARDGGRVDGDDFGGVRTWRVGESQRHIDWKAAARGQPLLIKQWTGNADATLILDWSALSDLGTEARLSQLARWIIHAERGGIAYALRLPGAPTLAPTRGVSHFHTCLRMLAEFPRDEIATSEASR